MFQAWMTMKLVAVTMKVTRVASVGCQMANLDPLQVSRVTDGLTQAIVKLSMIVTTTTS